MAVRTTSDAVKKIIEVEDTDLDLTPFITAANELVTELCSDSSYSTTRLTVIETWLAAHFFAVREPRLSSENAGVSVSYQGKVEMHLEATIYGQQVMMLDTAGDLASLHAGISAGTATAPRPGITWGGTPHNKA